MSADLSASCGPSAPGVSELVVEVLGRHTLTDSWWDERTEEWHTECGCNATFAAPGPEDDSLDEWEACAPYRRHVAEVIAASGVVVPAAEVREQIAEVENYVRRRNDISISTRMIIRSRLAVALARLAGERR